jgi:hypothetical protein
VYDESFADIQERDPRQGVYSLTMSFPDRLIIFFAQESEGEWRRVQKVGKQWVAVD